MQAVGSIASVVMALVWVVYFQIFLIQHRRQKRPSLLIYHAQGQDPDSACLLVNMSHNPVNVQCVVAEVRHRSGHCERKSITDYRRVGADDRDAPSRIRQGPIQAGGYLILGSFREIIVGERTSPGAQSTQEDDTATLSAVQSLEIQVAVVHGPSRYPIGARRRFVLEQDGDGSTRIRATNIFTEQLVDRRGRDTVRRWVEAHIAPVRCGKSESESAEQRER